MRIAHLGQVKDSQPAPQAQQDSSSSYWPFVGVAAALYVAMYVVGVRYDRSNPPRPRTPAEEYADLMRTISTRSSWSRGGGSLRPMTASETAAARRRNRRATIL